MSYPNDNFASATVLTGDSGSITPFHYDGVGDPATSEPGEDTIGAGETLWWKWTATSTGTAHFDTRFSPADLGGSGGLDTKVQVFTDFATSIASNDDDPSPPSGSYSYNSYVQFSCTAGTDYWLQVDMYGTGQAGTLHVGWGIAAPPTFTWTTVATDTFDRADSATDINPSSDGGLYTVIRGGAGISGNKGYFPVMDPLNDSALVYRDVGSSIVDISVDSYRTATYGSSTIATNAGSSPGPSYELDFDSSATATIHGSSGSETVTLTPWTGGTTRLRMVSYHGDDNIGHVLIFQDGVQVHEFIDGPGSFISNTGIILGGGGHSFGTFDEFFDNLVVLAGVRSTTTPVSQWQVGSVAW